jgi:hypothetical protein
MTPREKLVAALAELAAEAYVAGMEHAADEVVGVNTREEKRILAARARGRKFIRSYYKDPENADDQFLAAVNLAVDEVVAAEREAVAP